MKISRKNCVIAAIACGPALAHAQSSVVIYGIVDLGARHTSGLTAAQAAANGSATALTSGVDNTSRLGFRGTEDLGGGLRALFNLETGLNADLGTQANSTKYFDRASWVGLGGGWGTLTAGRQTTLLAEAIAPVDAVGMRFAAFNPNIVTTALSSHGLGLEYGASGANTGSYRLDNSIKYSVKVGPVTGRAMYAFGENSNSTVLQSSTGLGAVYQEGALTVSGAWQTFKSASRLDLDGATLGAAYQWGPVRLAANFGRSEGFTTVTARTIQKVASAGATWSVTPAVDLTAAYYRLERTRSTTTVNDGYARAFLFAEYKLSRRTRLYAEADFTDWKQGYQGAGNRSTGRGATLGVMHTF